MISGKNTFVRLKGVERKECFAIASVCGVCVCESERERKREKEEHRDRMRGRVIRKERGKKK